MAKDQNELEARGRAILEVIERVRERIKEQETLLAQLERHAKLLELGIDPKEISTFRLHANPLFDAYVTLRSGRQLTLPRELFLADSCPTKK